MKKLLLPLLLVLVACEDVIDVELPSTEPKLIIDALLRYTNEQEFQNYGQIKLSISAPYLEGEVLPANGATVLLIDETNGIEYEITESEPGIFDQGIPVFEFDVDYTLQVQYNGELYHATTQLMPTGTIVDVEQGDGFLFDEEEETEIIVEFEDIPNQRNYYLFDFGFEEYLVTDDEFYQDTGLTFSYFYEDIGEAESVTITLLGVDRAFADYFNLALIQSGVDGGNPFQVPTASVRGNILNSTNPENFPFGYFAISEFDSATLTIEE